MAWFEKGWVRTLGIVVLLGFFCLCIIYASLDRWLHEHNRFSKLLPFASHLMPTASLIEDQFYDFRTKHLYVHGGIDQNQILIAIDDQSLQAIGRWPWSRATIAKLVDRLGELGARDIAFDVIFSEPERVCTGVDADAVFVAAIKHFQDLPDPIEPEKKRKIIVAYLLTRESEEAMKEFPTDLYLSSLSGQNSGNIPLGFPYVNKETFPIEKLRQAEVGLAYINAEDGNDGVFRYGQIVSFIEAPLPSLPVALFQAVYQKPPQRQLQYKMEEAADTFQLLLTNNNAVDYAFRLNARGEMKIRYYGGADNFINVSAKDILSNDEKTLSEIKKKIYGKPVFVGSTAIGAHDLRHTPVDPELPGVYAHMNVFHMLHDRFHYQMGYEPDLIMSLALFFIGTFIIIATFQIGTPVTNALAFLLVVVGAFSLDRFVLQAQGYSIALFFCCASFLTSYTWLTFLKFLQVAQSRQKIKNAFGRYVSPSIVKEMTQNPEKLKLGGEKREITMLFSDIRGFTSISEQLNPQQLASLLNQYMDHMTEILFATQGTLDKYIGDAIVAFWGAPWIVPQHAYLAVQCARIMIETLPQVNESFKKQGLPLVQIGIGINTGEVSVGNMGSNKIFSYTALGDHMNLASRLEGLTKHYGAQIVISEYTYRKLLDKQSEFITRPLDIVQVKGKTEGVKIYEVLYKQHRMFSDADSLRAYNAAYKLYLERNFVEAKNFLHEVLLKHPGDVASSNLLLHCDQYIETPPESSWKGVTVFTTK